MVTVGERSGASHAGVMSLSWRRRTLPYVVVVLLVDLLGGSPGFPTRQATAQSITQEQAGAILEELRQIRLLLERGQRQESGRVAAPVVPDQRVALPLVEAYAIGRKDAPLILVEFLDYECPFCRQFHIATFGQLKKNYIDTGQIRFVSRDFPLDIHKHARGAAHAARCAGEQGKYWEMRHVLIVNASKLDGDSLPRYAADLALDVPQFQECVRSDRYGKAIHRDIADAQTAGITGTPSFVLGKASVNGIEGIKVVGALPYAVLEAKIRELLGSP